MEFDAKPVIENSQRAVPVAHDCFRHDRLYFLRNHADIDTIAAVIAEAVVTKPVRKVAEKKDIVLDRDIGSTAAATTSATAAASSTAAESAASAAAEAAAATEAAATGAGEACAAARRVTLGYSPGTDISQRVAAAATRRPLRSTFSARRPLARAWSSTRGPLPRAGPLARPLASARPLSRARSIPAWPEDLLATPAAEIHPILRTAAKIVVTELLPHVVVVVSDALAVFRPVLPIVATERVNPWPIDIDVIVVPIEAAAPPVSARGPISESPAGTKCQAPRDEPCADVSGIPPIVGWIRWIRPGTINNGRIVHRSSPDPSARWR